MDLRNQAQELEKVKETARLLMRLYYCDNDMDALKEYLAPQFVWIGTEENDGGEAKGEEAASFQRCPDVFSHSTISEEQYNVIEAAPGTYVCTGQMQVTSDPDIAYFGVQQRVTFVFQWIGGSPLCVHCHLSEPSLNLPPEEETYGDESDEPDPYSFLMQERLSILEDEIGRREHQLNVVMSSIPGGLVICQDDEVFTYEYVSTETAAMFGYTVDEFLDITHGTAAGAVYPPDREEALQALEECFSKNPDTYTIKYRIRCKDGSLKNILDSGRRAWGADGKAQVYILYLDITNEEHSIEAIREQQQLLQNIYDTVPCGILRFVRENGKYRLLSFNRAALELLSYENAEDCHTDWHDGVVGTVLEEDLPILLEANAALSEVGDQIQVSYRVRKPDGGIRYLSGTNAIVASSNGRKTIQRTIFDITDRVLLQKRLNQEQEMYRIAMESDTVIMYEYQIDKDLFISYEPIRNPGAKKNVLRLKLTDYQKKLRTGRYVHPNDIQLAIDNLCHGQAEITELRMITPQNKDEFVWFRATSKLISDEGRPVRVVGTLRNIQQEKDMLSLNQESLQMHQLALQALSSVYASIYYIDLSANRYYGVRISAKSQMSIPRMGDYKKEQTAYFMSFTSHEDAKRLLPYADPEFLSKRLHTVGQSIEVVFQYFGDNAQPKWMQLEYHLVSMEDGKPKIAISAYRDITESRRLELEHQEEEAKARHALEDAYATANQANQAKSDFFSKMSHDMRTPMNAIIGMTTIALNNLSNSARLRDCLQKIHMSSQHLLRLINEVLDMSKIESGSITLNEMPFDLHLLLDQTVDMIRSDVERRKQRLDVYMGDLEHRTVMGDQMHLQQILLNLLSNAVKYTPEQGHISLTLRELAYSSSKVGHYTFIVEDDGIGMSPEFLKKLFTPFERAEDSRVSHTQGTGLGMAITKNLVHMMGGSIQVDSHLNEGTRFTVTIGLKTAHPNAEPAAQEPEPAAADNASLKSVRLLLVEDNDLNREIARELLENEGIIIEEAEDGAQAVEIFCGSEPGHFQLILMDIQMPVMNGYQASRAIRSLGRPDAASIPIIALTANAFVEDVNRAHMAGMNAHLAKPLEISELLKTLKRWVN